MCAVTFMGKNYREGHYRLLIDDHKIFNSIEPNAMDKNVHEIRTEFDEEEIQ